MTHVKADIELDGAEDCRYFVSYSGIKLPLNLVTPIEPSALSNRNTFIQAYFDAQGLLLRFDKLVYGEVELSHRYEYSDDGNLVLAEIAMPEEEPVILRFGAADG
jgi:hypothetical protein